MKRRFEVRWYELNLTKRKSRKFFTEWGANLFVWYLKYYNDEDAKITKNG